MEQRLEEILQIPYVKLHFEVVFIQDTVLPLNKVSALRGGMGDMLLEAFCVGNGICDQCMFAAECMMQKTMYSQYERKPEFVTEGGSIGYVIECENYEQQFQKGSHLKFNLLLMGKTIAYIHLFLEAFEKLGETGLGVNHSKYEIVTVTNSLNTIIYANGKLVRAQYQILNIYDYVVYRQNRLACQMPENKLVFKTPVSLKYQGKYLREFQMEPILIAVSRRLFMLDCYIGLDNNYYQAEEFNIPEIICQNHEQIKVRRYSQRKDKSMVLKGIKGYCVVDQWNPQILPLLLAGELIHIGKYTSFGFGRYRVK